MQYSLMQMIIMKYKGIIITASYGLLAIIGVGFILPVAEFI